MKPGHEDRIRATLRAKLHAKLHAKLQGAVLALAVATTAIAVSGTAVRSNDPAAFGPPIEEYVQNAGAGASIVPAGQLKLDGWRVGCGNRSTVLDPGLDDFGAAYPNYLILNPKMLAKVPTQVKLWIHAHECGHQFRGPDEEKADCFAVQRGRRQKWLTPEGLDQICDFIRPSRGDSAHFGGPHRCELMRKCYASPEVE
jgi:hypothetical protein